jgi:hypothetical protein
MKESDGSITKLRKWVAFILSVGVWVHSMYGIFSKNDHLAQLFESDPLSAAIFSVFWFGLIGLGFALKNADFSKNEEGKVTGDSEITW